MSGALSKVDVAVLLGGSFLLPPRPYPTSFESKWDAMFVCRPSAFYTYYTYKLNYFLTN